MIPSSATRTPPTKPGWYWLWKTMKSRATVVRASLFIDGEGRKGLMFNCHGEILWFDLQPKQLQPRSWRWLEVAPPEARWFLPMPEPAGGPIPDPLF